jgi:hypothetical protein
VPYHLEFHEKAVVPFLEDSERISPAMREIIETSLEEHLGQFGDKADTPNAQLDNYFS